MTQLKLAIASVALLTFCGAAQASTSLLTSDAGYSGPELNLGPYADGSYNFTFGPVPIPGGITFIANPGGGGNSGDGSVIGQGLYGLGANGSFGGSAVYIGVDSGSGYDKLELSAPVSEIGFFFNYDPACCGNDATISTLDSSGNVVDSYDLEALAPISTPGGFNDFAFRGIESTSDNIYGLEIGGDYILASGTATGELTGGVPEPATWAMFLVGFGAIGFMLRGARRQQGAALTA